MTDSRARRMWKALEPYHAITYFSPETKQATDALGLKGGWMSYFGCRAAPLGPVGPDLVAALFYSFHPAMVARALPDAWDHATPAQLLDARLQAVDAAVRRLFPGTSFDRAADVARRAAELAPVSGRPMAAANAALEWPDEPHLVLWQATTILRESRGDGHVAALVGAGLSPCQACLTISAAGGPSKEVFQVNRRWSDEDWAAAEDDLRGRGVLDSTGALTDAGRALRQEVEDTTDRLADQGWRALGDDLTAELHDMVHPLSAQLMSAGFIPQDNPMAMRWD
ncbi:SCO6745 family protein [Kribbella sp. CWNU-51]